MNQSEFPIKLSLRKKSIQLHYQKLYPNTPQAFEHLIDILVEYDEKRSSYLKNRDKEGTKWLSEGKTVGMMLYVDLFSGDLKKLYDKVFYFESLGVTLIHLMPLLKSRKGDNDGGYAVSDYQSIEPKLGTMDDFQVLIEHYHRHGIRLCIDFVLNHTADDHIWIQNALEGDSSYLDYYRVYDTDDVPRAFEVHLGEVFPKVAPGNFTYFHPLGKWVMTTFYPFQWDLNYDNPEVFNIMVEQMLFLANVGVDMLRLDAIPYIWKTLGTDCRNLKEVHTIMHLMREIMALVAPATALLGEAIVAPHEIIKYFGTDDLPECHVLYNASYMVELWNTLATRDARHLTMMKQWQLPKDAHWINYARCHDDIGWGLDEDNIRQMGFEPSAHKTFLIDFYYGSLADSFSRGELYEFNPETLDARTSGTFASLCGLEKAIEERDDYQKELAVKRIRLMHALFILRKGIPMLYSGDEIAMLNDYNYKHDPNKQHDSRWLHRPAFNWEAALNPNPIESMVFNDIKALIKLRGQIQSNQKEIILVQGNPHVFALVQEALSETTFLLFNVTEDRQWVYTVDLKRNGLKGVWTDYLQGKSVNLNDEKFVLGPYEFLVLHASE